MLSAASMASWAQEAQNSPEEQQPSTQPATTPIGGNEATEQASSPTQLGSAPLPFPNYGSLLFDWGFCFLRKGPSDLSFWGSRFANLYLCHNIRLGNSHFTISPAIGLAFEGFGFKEAEGECNTLIHSSADDVVYEDAKQLFPRSEKIIDASLDVRYVDLMLETRFNLNKKYPKESFFVALGGKLGMLWKASTTVAYKEDKETKACTHWEGFNLKKWRYGWHVKLGWGRFSLCYTHMLSELFQEKKGPWPGSTKSSSLGVSIDLF